MAESAKFRFDTDDGCQRRQTVPASFVTSAAALYLSLPFVLSHSINTDCSIGLFGGAEHAEKPMKGAVSAVLRVLRLNRISTLFFHLADLVAKVADLTKKVAITVPAPAKVNKQCRQTMVVSLVWMICV